MCIRDRHHAGLQLNLYVILGHFLDGRRHGRFAQHDAHGLFNLQGSGIHLHQRGVGDGSGLGGSLGLVGARSIGLARRGTARLLRLVFLLLGVGAAAGKDTLFALLEGLFGMFDVLFGQQLTGVAIQIDTGLASLEACLLYTSPSPRD